MDHSGSDEDIYVNDVGIIEYYPNDGDDIYWSDSDDIDVSSTEMDVHAEQPE